MLSRRKARARLLLKEMERNDVAFGRRIRDHEEYEFIWYDIFWSAF